MVLLHHCSGLTPNAMWWAEKLRSQGYVALAVNSFGVRNVRHCSDLGTLDHNVREIAADGIAALQYLRGQPFVDPVRIGVMGWSLGGMATLTLAATAGPPERSFRVAIAFYPYCDPYLSGSRLPLLLLLGGADTLTPWATCVGRARRLQQQGQPVDTEVYPDAKHGFDAEELTRPGAAVTNLAYDQEAHAKSAIRVAEFLQARLRR